MSKYTDRAAQLRAATDIHYNCAQTVVLTYAEECGITPEKALQVSAHFGSGMKMAATCGAITGALMVIGMLGGGDDKYRAFMSLMRAGHDGMTDCSALLKKNAETGKTKKEHCDAMVFEAIEGVAKVMGLE